MRSEDQNGIVTGNGALTEQALGASELSCRRLFEAAQDGILILDVDTGRLGGAHFGSLALPLLGKNANQSRNRSHPICCAIASCSNTFRICNGSQPDD
jgi:hypothetical protein